MTGPLGWTDTAAQTAELGTSVWTGRLDFAVIDDQGAVKTMEIVIRLDVVTVRDTDRSLAFIDRDHLRSWLLEPRLPLEVDDVRLRRTDSAELLLQIDREPPVTVPQSVVIDLCELV
jgi:hypothetical protein